MEELKAIHSTTKQLKKLKPYDQNTKGKEEEKKSEKAKPISGINHKNS